MSGKAPKLDKLVEIFNQLFFQSENVRLQIGADEPFYRAAKGGSPAIIYSREDFLSSALHEIAHWCVAGVKRRGLDDFGYWYKPEGRSLQEQLEFEKVEVKPQAIEWALSLACNHIFNFSADNVSQNIDASASFKKSVTEQLKDYLMNDSLPTRAALLFNTLRQHFNRDLTIQQILPDTLVDDRQEKYENQSSLVGIQNV
ncbi:elongation factor P hydroxylase [Aliikangiella coralliicola]|uniref:Elongation factor P hydroxylase n=1 Tax=Aliikangiella coralliicola TaxID=2592383 RepID=A0A545UBA7_9GAMM|nr:elongation factor P hydroxylase [Aliikangiella coralliicola]TQV86751.1 elongation factor P hydroxylase [Aliikangiella coralliicola]